jgi:pyruvate formate lyase activating enzyme
MGIQGTIHSVETFGTLDGPGIRYVLFLQGCSLRCRFCHNPDTWAMEGTGTSDSAAVVEEILSYRSFIRTGGVTVSGGEPLLQPEFVLDILKRCRRHGLHTAIDTAGAVPLARSRAAIEAADLLLLDIKSLDEKQCFSLTGAGNANTLSTLDFCEQIGKPVWLRHVLVPGWTLDRERLERLAAFLKPYRCIEQVELLPYHAMGRYKWEQLHLSYPLKDVPEPTAEECSMARKVFEDEGLSVLMTRSDPKEKVG